MKRFIEGESRDQVTLLPECLDDYIGEDNPVRVIDLFVDELDMAAFDYTTTCRRCDLKEQCTTGKERRVRRWEHEGVLDAMQNRLDSSPGKMKQRRCTVEPVFGTLKFWMGSLPDEDTQARWNRDEFACSCIQPAARYEHSGHCGHDEGYPNGRGMRAVLRPWAL